MIYNSKQSKLNMFVLENKTIGEFYDFFTEESHDTKNIFFRNRLQRIAKEKNLWKKLAFKIPLTRRHWYKNNFLRPFMASFCHFDFAKDIFIHKNKYIKLYDTLEDKMSKEILLAILSYKVTKFEEYLHNYTRFVIDQYFEPELIKFDESGEVFVDCGGYTGDTAMIFKRLKIPQKAYYFLEPDPNNINFAKHYLEEFNDIKYFQAAVGDKATELFLEEKGSGSFLANSGSVKVKVDTLDNLIKKPITFIKMDIEGYEEEALLGARQQIVENKPKLAISAYHKPSDAWKLVETIKSIRSDYKIYLRLYQSSYCEAIIYAI